MYRLSFGERHVDVRHVCLVGRSDDCDVAFRNDHSVSRYHAKLTVCAHGVVLEDLGSTNGVWVDGRRLDRAQLVVGTHVLRIGDNELRLTSSATPRTRVLPHTVSEAPTARGLRPVDGPP